MSETATFSSSGEEAITRQIDISDAALPQEFSADGLNDYFDIDRTVNEIIQHNYKRIALQFPDELLSASVPVFRALKARIGPEQELYVLADTSYGSCCVDEVAAQHVDADAMVHYGHACMSQTSRLPVIYVFGKDAIDVDDCVAKLGEALRSSESTPSRILLKSDVRYAYVADSIADRLQNSFATSTIIYTSPPLFSQPAATQSEPTSTVEEEESYETILYVGCESLGLTNLLMTNSSSNLHSYDPKSRTTKPESTRTNRLLMRRYAAVQKARDADVFGILVGTLGVASYLPLISRIRSLLARSHKKSYTITVGKLNPAKLGNFLEIECFVLVACPENSLVEAKEFLRPIITPFELEVALQSEPTWTGKYVLDFGKLSLDDSVDTSTAQETSEDEDRPQFSLVTGTYRQSRRFGEKSETEPPREDNATSLVARNSENTLSVLSDSAASHFLHSRTYRGLETRLGEDAPSVLEQGRSGMARGYQTDHREN